MLILPFSAKIEALNIKVFRALADMNMTREEMKNWKFYMTAFLMNVPSVIIDISANMASSRAITEDAISVLNVDIQFAVPSLPSTIVEDWTREK